MFTKLKLTSLACLALAAGGCLPYAAVQRDLAREARQGVTLARQAQDQRQATVRQQLDFKRQMLDQAFDDDVRSRSTLDPDWVIVHRKAYVTAIDALAAQRSAIEQSDIASVANLAAIEQALTQIQLLAESETRWTTLFKRN